MPELFVCVLLHASERPTLAGSAAFSRAMLSNSSWLLHPVTWNSGTDTSVRDWLPRSCPRMRRQVSQFDRKFALLVKESQLVDAPDSVGAGFAHYSDATHLARCKAVVTLQNRSRCSA